MKKYKFKSLKTFGSTEWLFENKKYRRVFCREETTYIYAELALYNKLFDEEEWDIHVNFKGYEIDANGIKGKEICNLNASKHVGLDDNIMYFREGWGNTLPGNFWKKGAYRYEAFVEGEAVGFYDFYIEEEPPVTEKENCFFTLESIKLFEGPKTKPETSERVYYQKYNSKESRYIWGEVNFKSLLPKDYHCELFFEFFNDAGQLKGRSTELTKISGDKFGQTVSICSGWGNAEGGSWYPDNYILKVVFMDQLLAAVPFSVGAEFEEGITSMMAPDRAEMLTGSLNIDKTEDNETLEQVMLSVEELIGLTDIKQKLHDYVDYLTFLKVRQEKGFEESQKINLHSVFTGNPGTGKTTVARKLGKIYKKMGLLSKGHVHEADRSDLVGEFIGQTAPKIKKAIQQARGGILFIDEAYSLARTGEDSKDFGKEVIEILLKEMSDGPGDLAVIVAGYPREMENFIVSNPGLKSRFSHYFHFPDYLPQELSQIAELGLEKRSLTIVDEAKEFLNKKLTDAFRERTGSFGNARYVMSLIDEAKMNLGLRIVKTVGYENLDKEELSTVTLPDLEKIFSKNLRRSPDIKVDDELLHEALKDLNALIGMQEIKDDVHELVKLVKYYKEIGKDVLNKFVLHTVFTGNPGTGKTTVARILANIFKALGILEKGHLVECSRENLVAEYLGQTAGKTSKAVEEATGGILFIDEAYALVQNDGDSYGKEAVTALLKHMEDKRENFVVVAAGYPDNMKDFLESNPGLQSRFDRTFSFSDYTPDEMAEICTLMLKHEDLKADESAAALLHEYFTFLYSRRDKHFGNARDVRKVVQEAVKNQNLRMASLSSAERTPEMIRTLLPEDVKEFIPQENRTAGLGFRIAGA